VEIEEKIEHPPCLIQLLLIHKVIYKKPARMDWF